MPLNQAANLMLTLLHGFSRTGQIDRRSGKKAKCTEPAIPYPGGKAARTGAQNTNQHLKGAARPPLLISGPFETNAVLGNVRLDKRTARRANFMVWKEDSR
jgi:hypothetical protein